MNFRTLSTVNYNDFALAYIKQFEDVAALPYVDSRGIPTIGIGFNLRAHMEPILQELGVDTSSAEGQELLADLQQLVDGPWTYAQVSTLREDLTRTYRESGLTDGEAKFELSADQMDALFYDLKDDFEASVTGAIPVYVPTSYERAVFLSLSYNNIIKNQASYSDDGGQTYEYTEWGIPSLRDSDAILNENAVRLCSKDNCMAMATDRFAEMPEDATGYDQGMLWQPVTEIAPAGGPIRCAAWHRNPGWAAAPDGPSVAREV